MSSLHGTGQLLRFALRRDRIWLGVWVLAIAAVLVGSAASVIGLYPDQASLDQAAALIQGNSTVIALNGPAQGLDSLGGRVMFEVGSFAYVMVGLMSMFLVGRHTRAEEESGRAELLGASAIGRNATLGAAAVMAVLANVGVAALTGLGLLAAGLDATGTLAFSCALAAVGLAFAALSGVACQVSSRARSAYGLAGIVIGAAYVLRAIGDTGSGWASWLSPIGWGQAVRPFAGERWWVLVLPLGCAALATTASVVLTHHRDLGAGLIQDRPGPARASRLLGLPEGLALRLQRGILAGWVAGLALLGLAYGSVAQDIGDFVSDNDALRDLLTQQQGDIVSSYLAVTLLITALVGSGFAVQAALRPRTEETAGRAEPVLSVAVPRWRWGLAFTVVAALGTALVGLAAGLGLGATYGASVGDAGQILRLGGAALAQVPAMWVLVGIAFALVGVAPRLAPLAWAALAGCLVVGFLGELLKLPNWVRELSPFEHTSRAPSDSVEVLPLLVLTLIAAALVAIGLLGLRRRDIATA